MDTNSDVYFSYRWGSYGNWKRVTLQPNDNEWFSIHSDTDFNLRFDDNIKEGYQEALYTLDKKYSYSASCHTAKKYTFRWSNGELKLYK
ncbi:hypothetical protein GCM10007877_39110 [Marinibactrum halimedae]|uniref:Uncharacterized protein n=1 Tax=Marinibactrum halimedae TaxID=1444977 RepID=A0AA37WRB7_9GAMM|nr:hypothetical protein GCM10007877_39110 [Marinibactrum halimedae]